jgi:hypothetical protein
LCPRRGNIVSASNLAFAALLTGLIGMCLPCPFWLVSIGLGIATLVKLRNNPELGAKGVAIVGMVLPVVWFLLVGLALALDAHGSGPGGSYGR